MKYFSHVIAASAVVAAQAEQLDFNVDYQIFKDSSMSKASNAPEDSSWTSNMRWCLGVVGTTDEVSVASLENHEVQFVSCDRDGDNIYNHWRPTRPVTNPETGIGQYYGNGHLELLDSNLAPTTYCLSHTDPDQLIVVSCGTDNLPEFHLDAERYFKYELRLGEGANAKCVAGHDDFKTQESASEVNGILEYTYALKTDHQKVTAGSCGSDFKLYVKRSHANVVADKAYQIRHVTAEAIMVDSCLGVLNDAVNAEVQRRPCSSGESTYWRRTNNGFELLNSKFRGSGLCMTHALDEPGGSKALFLETCDPHATNQQILMRSNTEQYLEIVVEQEIASPAGIQTRTRTIQDLCVGFSFNSLVVTTVDPCRFNLRYRARFTLLESSINLHAFREHDEIMLSSATSKLSHLHADSHARDTSFRVAKSALDNNVITLHGDGNMCIATATLNPTVAMTTDCGAGGTTNSAAQIDVVHHVDTSTGKETYQLKHGSKCIQDNGETDYATWVPCATNEAAIPSNQLWKRLVVANNCSPATGIHNPDVKLTNDAIKATIMVNDNDQDHIGGGANIYGEITYYPEQVIPFPAFSSAYLYLTGNDGINKQHVIRVDGTGAPNVHLCGASSCNTNAVDLVDVFETDSVYEAKFDSGDATHVKVISTNGVTLNGFSIETNIIVRLGNAKGVDRECGFQFNFGSAVDPYASSFSFPKHCFTETPIQDYSSVVDNDGVDPDNTNINGRKIDQYDSDLEFYYCIGVQYTSEDNGKCKRVLPSDPGFDWSPANLGLIDHEAYCTKLIYKTTITVEIDAKLNQIVQFQLDYIRSELVPGEGGGFTTIDDQVIALEQPMKWAICDKNTNGVYDYQACLDRTQEHVELRVLELGNSNVEPTSERDFALAFELNDADKYLVDSSFLDIIVEETEFWFFYDAMASDFTDCTDALKCKKYGPNAEPGGEHWRDPVMSSIEFEEAFYTTGDEKLSDKSKAILKGAMPSFPEDVQTELNSNMKSCDEYFCTIVWVIKFRSNPKTVRARRLRNGFEHDMKFIISHPGKRGLTADDTQVRQLKVQLGDDTTEGSQAANVSGEDASTGQSTENIALMAGLGLTGGCLVYVMYTRKKKKNNGVKLPDDDNNVQLSEGLTTT